MNIRSTLRRSIAIFLMIGLIEAGGGLTRAFANGTDDFNDNIKDNTKWGTDVVSGGGVMSETNQRLEYFCSIPTGDDDVNRPWILTRMPYNANWSVQVDVFNFTAPNNALQVSSSGILVVSPQSGNDNFTAELYASSLGGPPQRNGFFSELDTGGINIGTADTGGFGVTSAAVRIEFDATLKVFSVFYDVDPSNGYAFIPYGFFGIAGVGGANANTNWGLSSADQLSIYVYGFSAAMIVTPGQMYNDNFVETGGGTPTGPPPPIPVPTGGFGFGFPVNNPLLTAIVFLSGNFHGVTPTSSQRNYSIDVAQDETGKLMTMGTMDGIAGPGGNPQIASSVGSVKTVNGDPTAQLNGSFNGTRDGVATTFTGMAQVPAEVVDVGGGTDGVSGTGSYSSMIGGVPFSESNLPIQLAAPPGAVDNLHKDWSIHLDLTAKGKKKPKSQVGATLTLPNGDVIVFKKKNASFSTVGGFAALTFSNGKNSRTNKKDKMTTVTITGLTFAFQNGAWHATGGTIIYNFLGQQGTANLADFTVGP